MAKTLEEVLAELKAPPMNAVDFNAPIPKQVGDPFQGLNGQRLPALSQEQALANAGLPSMNALRGIRDERGATVTSERTPSTPDVSAVEQMSSGLSNSGGGFGVPSDRSTTTQRGFQQIMDGRAALRDYAESESMERKRMMDLPPLSVTAAETIRAMGGGPEAEMMARNAEMQQRKKESGARFQAQKTLRQMEEAGTPKSEVDKIKGQISALPPMDQMRAVQKFGESKQNLEKAGRTFDKRTLEKLNNPSSQTITRRGKVVEGYGDIRTQAKSILDFGNSVGPDIAGGKTYFELMTPSEWKRFRRGVTDMATGGDPTQLRRVNDRLNADMKIIKDREEKKFATKNAKLAVEQKLLLTDLDIETKAEKLVQLRDKAQTQEEQTVLDRQETEFEILIDKLGETTSATDKKALRKQIKEFEYGLLESANMVQMLAPDGRKLSVPSEKVSELEKNGATRI